jgi:hypothetical protein
MISPDRFKSQCPIPCFVVKYTIVTIVQGEQSVVIDHSTETFEVGGECPIPIMGETYVSGKVSVCFPIH